MEVIDWGEIDYREAFEKQKSLVQARINGEIPNSLVVCTHPAVVTLGRATRDGDVDGWAGEIAEINRGGRATYHGPNQVVIYPIIKLDENFENLKTRDLHGYMETIELAVVEALRQSGIEAKTSSEAEKEFEKTDSEKEFRGVWVGNKKIASIGIAVRKWVTYHGLALNVFADVTAFQGINPCGFSRETMTSMEGELGSSPAREEITKKLVDSLEENLR